jgi:hypothetical protein
MGCHRPLLQKPITVAKKVIKEYLEQQVSPAWKQAQSYSTLLISPRRRIQSWSWNYGAKLGEKGKKAVKVEREDPGRREGMRRTIFRLAAVPVPIRESSVVLAVHVERGAAEGQVGLVVGYFFLQNSGIFTH